MRVFLSILILIFSLQSLTYAEDIRDFQIEGMSVGDSLLDYMSIKNINDNVKTEKKENITLLFIPKSQNMIKLKFILKLVIEIMR